MRIAVREQYDENNAEVNDTAGRLFWRQNGVSAYDNTNKTFIITSIILVVSKHGHRNADWYPERRRPSTADSYIYGQ